MVCVWGVKSFGSASHTPLSAPSPLVGEGWGGGWLFDSDDNTDPPPCPSPTRGEGTQEPRALRQWHCPTEATV